VRIWLREPSTQRFVRQALRTNELIHQSSLPRGRQPTSQHVTCGNGSGHQQEDARFLWDSRIKRCQIPPITVTSS
jgi:hypothetical protein